VGVAHLVSEEMLVISVDKPDMEGVVRQIRQVIYIHISDKY
jgi:hypothetical protein